MNALKMLNGCDLSLAAVEACTKCCTDSGGGNDKEEEQVQ